MCKFVRVMSEYIGIRGRLLSVSTPCIVGVINCTPDSFYIASRVAGVEAACARVGSYVAAGVDVVDVGGYSSRPNAAHITEEEELARVLPVIRALRARFPAVLLSIDTHRASVARVALDHGVDMVNDISGGQDSEMFGVVADYGVPYILMHMRGTPQTMQDQVDYEDVVAEVFDFLRKRITVLHELGCKDVIADVGIGFAKTVEQNYALMANLSYFSALGTPLMVGVSRKSCIYKVLKVQPEEALIGTSMLHFWALTQGIRWLRVHDVPAAVQAVSLFKALQAQMS